MIVQIKWIWIRILKWMILLIYQEADAKSKPDSVVDNGGDTDMTADIANQRITHDCRTNEKEPELQNEVDKGIVNEGG